MIKVGLIGITSAFLALFLQKDKKELSVLIGVCAGGVIFSYILAEVSLAIGFIDELTMRLPVDKEYLFLLFKLLGITYVAEFSANICKDAGALTIAGQIELFAKLAILILSIPSLKGIIEMIGEFI